MSVTAAFRALNEAAHIAAREARKAGDQAASELARLAAQTDALVDRRA